MTTNKKVSDLIAARLVSGLQHPGGPDRQPMLIALPVFRTAGMPSEMVDQVNTTAVLIAEAIVHLIETESGYRLVPAEKVEVMEFEEKRNNKDPLADVVPVHCRCDRTHTDPLMFVTVNGPRVVVDGKQLIKGLQQRSAECPHKVQQ